MRLLKQEQNTRPLQTLYKTWLLLAAACSLSALLFYSGLSNADPYQRNKAVPVEKVLFGQVTSVRQITETELIEDRNQGWKVFGGALIGAGIGHQFGGGSGQDIATILGALIGGASANERNPKYYEQRYYLVELLITTDEGEDFLVVQDLDSKMLFQNGDPVRIIYLQGGFVRVDKQL